MRILITLATAVTTVATVAFAQMAPTKTGDSAKGKVLTNDKGMTCMFSTRILAASQPAMAHAPAIGRP